MKKWHIKRTDDFGDPILDIFIDGKTVHGPWAFMTPDSFKIHGIDLGTGLGQRYEKRGEDWEKVAG